MAESADATDLKSVGLRPLRVQIPPSAQLQEASPLLWLTVMLANYSPFLCVIDSQVQQAYYWLQKR